MKILNFFCNTTFKLMVKLKESYATNSEESAQLHLSSTTKTKQNVFIRNLDLFILAYATVRFWSISLMMYLDYQALPLWKFDYYARWVYDFRDRFDPLGPPMFWLWTVLIFALSRLLNRLPQQAPTTFTFDLFYQIVVSSRVAYQRSLYSADQLERIVARQRTVLFQKFAQKSAFFLLIFGDEKNSSILACQAAALYCWATMSVVNWRRFARLPQSRLDCMPSLSLFWRLQVARWGLFIDGAVFYVLIIASMIVFSFCSLFLVAGRRLPLPFGLVVVHVLLENLIILVSVLRLIRCLSILLVVGPVLFVVFPRHLRQAVHQAVIRAQLSTGKSASSKNPQWCRFFLTEQHRLTKVLCTTNAQFYGPVALALVAVLLPNNLYFVGYFFYRQHEPVFRNFLLVAIGFTSITGVCSVFLALTAEVLTEPVHFLSRMQINLKGGGENRGLKMKLDGLMAALCASSTTIGLSFTVGPLANITVFGIYEFLGFYTGSLLFAFGNFM